jgi:ABC-type branched-subunit amino acid transport system substrate-binding protein
MKHNSRLVRTARNLGVVAVVTALLAGCGGSAVEAEGTAADVAAAQPDSAGTSVAGADAAAVPAAGTGASVAVPGTPAQAGGAQASTTGNAGATAAKPGKTKAAGTTSGTTGAGVPAIMNSAIFGGNAPCKPATLSPVNIGNVSTLSGVLGELHEPAANALGAFVQAQNSCGGLNGHKINLLMEDDQGDPSTAAVKVQALAAKKVLAFVGNIESLTIDGALPAIKRAGIPVVGGDITNNTWFTNPILFPQGAPPQAVSYGYSIAARDYFHKTKMGNFWCIEVPRACEQIDRAFRELAPKLGVEVVQSTQVSITSPSYTTQCLDFKSKGIEVVALTVDAATMSRIARSCSGVGYHPSWVAYPLGLGNESQFLGLDMLANTYVPLNTFPWMGNSTPAEKYWQAAKTKYIPGETLGGAATLAWTAGALLVAASSGLSAENPTSQQLLDTLYTFKGQPWTTLGGLTVPLTFGKDTNPSSPYCLFAAISNAKNNGWSTPISNPTCTNLIAPSDPRSSG